MAADEKWYFTKEQLINTPSRRCGIDADKELSYRQQAANFIQDMGQRLVVNSIAVAALFLAAKVEEQPRKLEHVIKMAHMCLHRDQAPPDIRSEQYLEQAQDLVFNENVLLQTLGFDVAIDHPHTHVVRCCQLVKASKDLAQTSYFMASNSLHLTTMCLQYKPTVVACFCIHLACKWSNWEIPQSNEGKHWFWYVDRSVTSELLQQLTAEFLHIFDKCPSRLKKKIMSISANQSPSINHTSLPNSPFDAEPRKVQSPATGADGGPTFHSNRPHHSEKQEEKKQMPTVSTRPPLVDYREYREKKERERLEREKVTTPATSTQNHAVDLNKHHSHHHKPASVSVPSKHPLVPGQKTTIHHNHHHRPEIKVGQPVLQRHSTSNQSREPNRDLNRQKVQREYHSSTGTSSGNIHSHGHIGHQPKDNTNLDNSLPDSSSHRSDIGMQELTSHSNLQDKLSNNNHTVHRLTAIDNKHQLHDKRVYDPRHKTVEHRKDSEQKTYGKYPDSLREKRKPDTLEQRCEEVRKLIEKPLPPPKPALDLQYATNTQKQSHYKYNQSEKLQVTLPTDIKMTAVVQNTCAQEKSPTNLTPQISQKCLSSKAPMNQHSTHGMSQTLKDTIKNGNSQSSCTTFLNNIDDPKAEKRPRHDDSTDQQQQNLLQTPPNKHKSLFSPEKVPVTRESQPQKSKSKQKTPPSAVKVPKQDRVTETTVNLNLVSPFASPALQQPDTVKRSISDITTSHKKHRTSSSDNDQQLKVKIEDTSSFEAMKMLGRVPELIQPIRDNLSSNNRNTSVANDLKPPELIKPFEPEPLAPRFGTMIHQQSLMNQQRLTNGLDTTNIINQEAQEFHSKKEIYKTELPINKVEQPQIKTEYLSPMKSVQSISALLQEPLAPMPSLLQGMQPFSQITSQQMHQEQLQEQQQTLSHSQLLSDHQVAQCMTLPSTNDASIASTVDISALSVPVQITTDITTSASSALPVPTLTVEEKKTDHHKSEKKKKEKKHKHKDKDKTKDKHKHKHKDKDKEKHREKEKDKGEEPLPAAPIKITIPKEKLNLSNETAVSSGVSAVIPDKNKSPQNTGLKLKIPKDRLKGAESVPSSPAQPVMQAPLKMTIRTDALWRSSGTGGLLAMSSGSTTATELPNETRKRDRTDLSDNTLSNAPPAKKQSQVSAVGGYGQHRPAERQNGRHYTSGSNNKVRGAGRGSRQYIGRGLPPSGSAGHYSAVGQRDGYYQQDTYNSNSVRNPHHSLHPPTLVRGDSTYARAGHIGQSQTDSSYFYANYLPPSMYNPAGYMYDPAMYYQQYQQQYPMYPAGNVIMTPDGAIDTSVPPPSLPPNIRQNQITICQQGASAQQDSNTAPPLPSGPPPNSSPPPPPPPE